MVGLILGKQGVEVNEDVTLATKVLISPQLVYINLNSQVTRNFLDKEEEKLSFKKKLSQNLDKLRTT